MQNYLELLISQASLPEVEAKAQGWQRSLARLARAKPWVPPSTLQNPGTAWEGGSPASS